MLRKQSRRVTKLFILHGGSPKSFARNDLRRAKPPRRDLSPYVATTYDDSAEQMVCQKKIRNIPRIIVDEGLTLPMYMV